MKIVVGTANKIKIEAVMEVIAGYDFLKDMAVEGIDAGSGVADQPKTLEETVIGAKNRAVAVFTDGDYGVGIEDGLMVVGGSLTGFMNICVCSFYDGKTHHLGLSPAFEYPPKAIGLVAKEGVDINQAFYSLGLTDNPKVGSAQGAIGILTKGRWDRKLMVKLAVAAALIQLDNKDLY